MIKTGITLDLTDFNGRVIMVSNLRGRIHALKNALKKVTFDKTPFVLISTGNTFDYGPDSFETLINFNSQLSNCASRVVTCIGAEEMRMLRALGEISPAHKFVHDTWLRQQWRKNGGHWHDSVNRYALDQELSKFKSSNSALFVDMHLKGKLRACVVHADLPRTDITYGNFVKRFMEMDYSKAKAYLNTFINSKEPLEPQCERVDDLKLLFTNRGDYWPIDNKQSAKRVNDLTGEIVTDLFVGNATGRSNSSELYIREIVKTCEGEGNYVTHLW